MLNVCGCYWNYYLQTCKNALYLNCKRTILKGKKEKKKASEYLMQTSSVIHFINNSRHVPRETIDCSNMHGSFAGVHSSFNILSSSLCFAQVEHNKRALSSSGGAPFDGKYRDTVAITTTKLAAHRHSIVN